MLDFLDKEHASAALGPSYSRWLMAAAALLIHFPLGQVYGFSVFNGPLAKLLGQSLTSVGWIFSVAIVFLGLAAAVFGQWVERKGPRKAMITAAILFCSGLVVSAVGVKIGSLPLVILGYGALGGVGLGIGYISPVSTLIKWFPDRRGMATGLAIMGFGGGALVGAPLAVNLMSYFKVSSTNGIAEAMLTMAAIYFIFQMAAVSIARLPNLNYRPRGWQPKLIDVDTLSDAFTVSAAVQTPQFWLLWAILLLNVSAGIAILSQASLMSQRMAHMNVTAATGYVGFLSICNMSGRFVWSTFSDKIGRKAAYAMYAGIGAIAFCTIPWAATSGHVGLFVGVTALVMSFYGAGFATAPAYLADMFGKREVGAIFGRLLTAWSLAGVIGPFLVNFGRDYLVKNGSSDIAAYSTLMYVLASLLAIEFLLNLFLKKPGAARLTSNFRFMPEKMTDTSKSSENIALTIVMKAKIAFFWALALIPLGWGIYQTAIKIAAAFI